jgi:hypothetical protein
MPKLESKTKSNNNKLKNNLRENSKVESKKSLVKQIKHKEYPRSYRFDSEIMNTLKYSLDRVNEISPKKVSEARFVKALILLSKEIDDEKILKALKEVW